MTAYCCCLLGTLLAAMGLLALRRGPRLALPALVLGGGLGVLLAKILYFVLMLPYVWPRWGFATLLRTDPATFSFFGLCLGLCLGVALAARLTGRAAAQTMDGFAPVLAAFIALARMGEYFLGVQGSGSYVENEALCFFPLAVKNEWDEWYWAVFMLSGLLAVLCAAGVLLRERRWKAVPGLTFRRTAFYLALPQVLCESLRAECMRWGFVKVEQVLCGVVIAGMVALSCHLVRGRKRWLPLLCVLLLIAGVVGVEFGLDKSGIAAPPWYGAMVLLLVGMAGAECLAVRRELRKRAS